MTPPSPTATKAEWRAWARTLDATPDDVARAVHEVAGTVVDDVAGPVLGYMALADEITCPPGTSVLPRLGPDGSMTLHVASAELEVHPLGFAQPRQDAPTVPVGDIAAVLVPGRVFDRAGFRLGRGGGHYDRLVPTLRADVPIVGITCTARIVDALPRAPHDRPMTHLATEHALTSTREPSEVDGHFVENE